MHPTALSLLGSPLDTGPLDLDTDGMIRGEDGVWPVLGGIPILVPDPGRWLASRRDAVLAALAEAGLADAPTVARLDTFARSVTGASSVDVPDDFVDDEDHPPELVEGPTSAAVRALVATGVGFHDRLAEGCGAGPVLEIGCGAGPLTRRITGRPLVVVDRSLRAVLRSIAGTDAIGVVGEADALPVAPGVFGTVVAANLIDLVDEPGAFVSNAVAALRPGGHLVLSTPDPALGIRGGTDELLVDLLEEAGLTILDDRDGDVWVRVHSPRHVQVYLVRRIVAVLGA